MYNGYNFLLETVRQSALNRTCHSMLSSLASAKHLIQCHERDFGMCSRGVDAQKSLSNWLSKQLHKDMRARVIMNSLLSKDSSVNNEVKQGSVITPALFSLYLSAMVEGPSYILQKKYTSEQGEMQTCLMWHISRLTVRHQ